MPIIKEKIRYTGTTTNIKFSLSSDDGFLGYQQEIDNLTQVVGIDLINPHVDVEERRFKNSGNGSNVTTFQFTLNGVNYVTSYKDAGFTIPEIIGSSLNKLNKLNSFYIFEYYDTYDISTQTKIFTTYLTKIGTSPQFTINTDNQLFYLYIPIAYMNRLIESGTTIVTGYTNISFFNAKSGSLTLFYNTTYGNLSTPQKMYFNTELDLINKTWKFINPATITGRQLWTSSDYVNKINNTFTKFDNEKQNYPAGSIFDKATGKYS